MLTHPPIPHPNPPHPQGESYWLRIGCIQNSASDPACSSSPPPSGATTSSPSPPGVTATSPPPTAAAGSNPCFAAETTVCLLHSSQAAEAAFAQCFGSEEPITAHRVAMSSLVSGDIVLSSSSSVSRVAVTQHRPPSLLSSALTTLHFQNGSLSLTPDHVVYLDGSFVPARLAMKGTTLSGGQTVTHMVQTSGRVINPITLAGTILAAGPTGVPVTQMGFKPTWPYPCKPEPRDLQGQLLPRVASLA